jgi:integrase
MKYDSVEMKRVAINLGNIGTFVTCDDGSHALGDDGLRKIAYFKDNIIRDFPLLFADEQTNVCNEFNLFLIQKYLSETTSPHEQAQRDDVVWSKAYSSPKASKLDIETVVNIAKDLKAFLQFLIENNFDYKEVVAAPISKFASSDSVSVLPVWQYQAHLCERVAQNDSNKLSFNVAKRRIRRVRNFYMWSYNRGLINALPFSMEMKFLGVNQRSSEEHLFQLPSSQSKHVGSLATWVSNLDIPKTLKGKSSKRDGLQPYSPKELISLLSTETAKGNGTYSLFLKCAYLGGLRSFECVQINFSDVVNPDEVSSPSGIYRIILTRKHHFPKTINITRTLMRAFYQYTQTDTWTSRRKKHESKYGLNNQNQPLPLFINKSGERMSKKTPSSSITEVRKEQRRKSLPVLERTYHDLRSTFGTYLALYLIDKNDSDISRVRSELRKWMGHEKFSTTELYIDFAKATDPTEYGSMHDWIMDIYNEVDVAIEKTDSDVKQWPN